MVESWVPYSTDSTGHARWVLAYCLTDTSLFISLSTSALSPVDISNLGWGTKPTSCQSEVAGLSTESHLECWRSCVSAGQFHQRTFSLLLRAENREESFLHCMKFKRDYATSTVCFHVGVTVDKHSTLLIKVSVK